MFLDEISIQTSILIYAGLGFVFFLGFGYYFFKNPVKKGQSTYLAIILGCLRGLILASLLIAIFPFKYFDHSNTIKSVDFIFIVDFPEYTNNEFNQTFRKVDSILKIKHPDLTWIDFKGQVVNNFKKPLLVSRSLNQLNQTIRRLNKAHTNQEIWILTDGNLKNLNVDLTSNIHFIPHGKILNKEEIEFSTANLPIISVPGEEIHLPIEVWVKNFKQNKNVMINVYLDGAFLKKEKISFDVDHTYLMTDVMLKSDQLGKHQLKVSLASNLYKVIDWNVVKEKAIVYGFSDALDPDVGVLNRVAKNKFIKLIWNFNELIDIPSQADKFIFMRILPTKTFKNKVLNSSVLFLNTPKDKTQDYVNHINSSRHLSISEESLWDLQMKEFQLLGSYAKSDSTIGTWFDVFFDNNTSMLDSLDQALSYNFSGSDISNNSLGRNEPKLNFLASKNRIDLLEIDALDQAEFVNQESRLLFKEESTCVGHYIYFKFWLLFLILAEWLLRKFNELR